MSMKEKQMTLISELIIDIVVSGGTRENVKAVIAYSKDVMDLYKEEESK